MSTSRLVNFFLIGAFFLNGCVALNIPQHPKRETVYVERSALYSDPYSENITSDDVITLADLKQVNVDGKLKEEGGKKTFESCHDVKWNGVVLWLPLLPIPLLVPTGKFCDTYTLDKDRVVHSSIMERDKSLHYCCGYCTLSNYTLPSFSCGKD